LIIKKKHPILTKEKKEKDEEDFVMDLEKKEENGNVEENNAEEQKTAGDTRASRDEGEVDYGRREFLSDRRSFLERRQSGDPAPGNERRSGNDRRVVLSQRRAPIDRRDMAFFDEFDDENKLGGE
jgi:hypothetical protein